MPRRSAIPPSRRRIRTPSARIFHPRYPRFPQPDSAFAESESLPACERGRDGRTETDGRLPSHGRSGGSPGVQSARRGRLTKPPRERQPGVSQGGRGTRQPRQKPGGAKARPATAGPSSSQTRTFGGRSPPDAGAEERDRAARRSRRRSGAGAQAPASRERQSGSAGRRYCRKGGEPSERPPAEPPGFVSGEPAGPSGSGGEPGRTPKPQLRRTPEPLGSGHERLHRRGSMLPRQWGPVATPAPIIICGHSSPGRGGMAPNDNGGRCRHRPPLSRSVDPRR